ncbi:MAG: hypothetical protein AAF514_16665, partial [Verrucomicrobiota bacterium]
MKKNHLARPSLPNVLGMLWIGIGLLLVPSNEALAKKKKKYKGAESGKTVKKGATGASNGSGARGGTKPASEKTFGSQKAEQGLSANGSASNSADGKAEAVLNVRRALYATAQVSLRAGRVTDAIRELEAAMRLRPKGARKRGRLDPVGAQLEHLYRKATQTRDMAMDFFSQADDLTKKGNHPWALAFLNESLRLNPELASDEIRKLQVHLSNQVLLPTRGLTNDLRIAENHVAILHGSRLMSAGLISSGTGYLDEHYRQLSEIGDDEILFDAASQIAQLHIDFVSLKSGVKWLEVAAESEPPGEEEKGADGRSAKLRLREINHSKEQLNKILTAVPSTSQGRGKLLGEAASLSISPETLFQAGYVYEKQPQPDTTRAAAKYRAFLRDPKNKRYAYAKKHAEDFLESHGLDRSPRYAHT